MGKIIKKIISGFFLAITVTVFISVQPVTAQEIWVTATPTPSVTVEELPSPSPSPSATTAPSPSAAPVVEPLPTGITSGIPAPAEINYSRALNSPNVLNSQAVLDPSNIFPENTESGGSAVFKPFPQVIRLLKDTYRSGENISVTVVDENHPDKIKVGLKYADGTALAPDMEEARNGNRTIIKIIPPPQFKPGKYTLKVTDSTGSTTEQDFNWGVLAINTTQSIYKPGQTVVIAMAVLDERGEMVCDAKVRLDITDPDGNTVTHSTETSSIKANPACRSKLETIEPDFEAHYTANSPGVYLMDLISVTDNGEYSINSTFEVRENIPYNVVRTSATRIYPGNNIPMLLGVEAVEDFEGSVSEIVPESFTVFPLEDTLPYKIVTTTDALTARKNIDNATDLALTAPFTGSYEMTNKFGKEEEDPLMKAKYEKYGVVGHDGVDYALPADTPVTAVDDGIVFKAKEDGDYGTTIIVQHAWGRSYYGHLSKIEKTGGSIVKKGEVLGLSGNTGLSTGPHLHFGLKLNENDPKNGYYGKTNPLLYIPIESGQPIVYSQVAASNYKVKVITWDVALKKGERLNIGYRYQAPAESPMFYTVGPARLIDNNNQVVFAESRFWQIAADADGSGTNTVDPTTGTTSETGKTYTFTFDPAETMDSGSIGITVPAGWSAPQGTAGTAGYTTAVGNTNATVANLLTNADDATNWAEDDTDMCNTFGGDTTNKYEGTGSFYCAPTAADDGDSIGYDLSGATDWSGYSEIAFWVRTDQTNSATGFTFFIDDNATGASPIQEIAIPAMNANTWTYVKAALSGTRTGVRTWGIQCNLAGSSNSDCGLGGTGVGRINIDYVLIGPGKPTFSGSGPWNINVILLDTAASDTITVTYGDGGGTSGVTNDSTEGTYEFTTTSRVNAAGTLTKISSSPTVTLSKPVGPTTDQEMRHGNWFSGGAEQALFFVD